MKEFTVLDLLAMDLEEHNALNLKCIGGRPGLVREITELNLNRPGLTLSGFFEEFAFQRIQVFGRGENAYINKLENENKLETVEKMFTYKIPCCIFTDNSRPGKNFKRIAENAGCALLKTDLLASEFSIRLFRALGNIFAPKQSLHGVLVEVFGIGILIIGDSGVGKSESALELIERGHRLISDDSVELRCLYGNTIIGSGLNPMIKHHMEIRGLGIINIAYLFGVGAIRDKKQVELVIKLEEWNDTKKYDRLGSKEITTDFLGVKIPYLEIPVKTGRNIPIIIETAAMNERLKKRGFHAAKEFDQDMVKWLESENARTVYYHKKNIYREEL